MKLKTLKITLVLVLSFLFVNCSEERISEPINEIELNKTNITLNVDDTEVLEVITEINGKSIEWISSDEEIAIVDSDGIVTAKKGGEVIIIAKVDEVIAEALVTVNPDVFVVGYINDGDKDIPAIWKNGELQLLDVGFEFKYLYGTSIFVSGQDVYVGGYGFDLGIDDQVAIVWKNSEPIILSREGENAITNSIFIRDNNVYVSGHVTYSGSNNGIIWKNFSQQNIIGIEDGSIETTSVYVSENGDEYVLGKSMSYHYYMVWKNGELIEPTFQSDLRSVQSIYEKNNNIYVLGHRGEFTTFTPTIWRNGIPENVTNETGRYEASSMFVSDEGDVYVIGSRLDSSRESGMVWVNGVPQMLESTTGNHVRPYSIYVVGDDVYVCGIEWFNNGYSSKAKLWVNGIESELPNQSEDSAALAVFVR
ncbi:Ig-like domain-containing protein [Tenacibaculum sp. IB213877]|uniref:Ig-like domain-containing protein n=1 Tax=Tenacibaculum sp. IB213877 TaxID=3097351 RepID=UPI002A5A5E16|nr:Ig-like domain-containing protein [Tenacibaculum sp. IB213877]MDY0779861.1 Ig-like domain-containing protein [Tenacibaculum sp. IB213877]